MRRHHRPHPQLNPPLILTPFLLARLQHPALGEPIHPTSFRTLQVPTLHRDLVKFQSSDPRNPSAAAAAACSSFNRTNHSNAFLSLPPPPRSNRPYPPTLQPGFESSPHSPIPSLTPLFFFPSDRTVQDGLVSKQPR